MFKCGDGRCVSPDKICDDKFDCIDAADERDCGKKIILNILFSTGCHQEVGFSVLIQGFKKTLQRFKIVAKNL